MRGKHPSRKPLRALDIRPVVHLAGHDDGRFPLGIGRLVLQSGVEIGQVNAVADTVNPAGAFPAPCARRSPLRGARQERFCQTPAPLFFPTAPVGAPRRRKASAWERCWPSLLRPFVGIDIDEIQNAAGGIQIGFAKNVGRHGRPERQCFADPPAADQIADPSPDRRIVEISFRQ